MDKVKQWTLTVSAVSIVNGLLLSLLPKNMHKNIYKFLTGIIFVYAILQPLIGSNGIEFEVGDYLKDNYEVSENADKYALSAMVNSAEKAIETLFSDEAEKQGINCNFKCKCSVINNELSVEKLTVSPAPEKSQTDLIISFAESLGIDKTILVFEGENNE